MPPRARVFWKKPEDESAQLFFAVCIVTVGAFMGGYHWTEIVTEPWLIYPFALFAVFVPVVIVIALAGFLIYASTKPNSFRYSRTQRINATPDMIFPLINDYSNWPKWSPYENRDPAMKRTFEGPIAGPGAIYSWNGNKNVGSGRMEILDATFL